MSTRKRARPLLEKNVGPVTFGMYLRVARTTLGITQTEMAKKLNITRSAVCEIEKGRHFVSPKLALKIAKVAKLSETQAVRLCLQDQLNRNQIKMVINNLSVLNPRLSRATSLRSSSLASTKSTRTTSRRIATKRGA